MYDQVDAPTHAARVGRLTVGLPKPARFAPTSGGGTHDDVQVAEQPWAVPLPTAGSERNVARERVWADRVTSALHADPPEDLRGTPDGDAGVYLHTREATLAHVPWARAVLQGDPTFDVLVRWQIVADAGPLALVAEGPASEEVAEDVLQRYLDVLDAYVLPDTPGYGDADWLYLRYGAIARPPRSRETVRAAFVDHPVLESVSVTTVSRTSPSEEPSLLERWHEAQRVGLRRTLGPILAPGADADAEEIRVGPKTTSTLSGEEVVSATRVGPAGDLGAGVRLLRFEWEHRGTPADGHDPDISVVAEARLDGASLPDQAALAAWDALLASLRLPRRVAADVRPPAGPYTTRRIDPPPLPLPSGPASQRGQEGWLEVGLPWQSTGNVLFPYDARVDGTRFRIGTGDFPAEDMFTLYVDGVPVASFNDWPDAWRRP